jgi:hypothetical protein
MVAVRIAPDLPLVTVASPVVCHAALGAGRAGRGSPDPDPLPDRQVSRIHRRPRFKRCSCLLSLLQTKETYRSSIWAGSGDPRPARARFRLAYNERLRNIKTRQGGSLRISQLVGARPSLARRVSVVSDLQKVARLGELSPDRTPHSRLVICSVDFFAEGQGRALQLDFGSLQSREKELNIGTAPKTVGPCDLVHFGGRCGCPGTIFQESPWFSRGSSARGRNRRPGIAGPSAARCPEVRQWPAETEKV